MLDGTIENKITDDTFTEGIPSTKLDFTVTLSKGNHVLELYGAQTCCDGETHWKFQVNEGDWLDFNIENLDKYKVVEAVDYTTVVEFGDINVPEGQTDTWIEQAITGEFNVPIVVMGPLTANGGNPMTVRVKDVTRKSFMYSL